MRGFIPFPRVLVKKVNETVRLEIERAYYEPAIQHVSHYAYIDSTYPTEFLLDEILSLFVLRENLKIDR